MTPTGPSGSCPAAQAHRQLLCLCWCLSEVRLGHDESTTPCRLGQILEIKDRHTRWAVLLEPGVRWPQVRAVRAVTKKFRQLWDLPVWGITAAFLEEVQSIER